MTFLNLRKEQHSKASLNAIRAIEKRLEGFRTIDEERLRTIIYEEMAEQNLASGGTFWYIRNSLISKYRDKIK